MSQTKLLSFLDRPPIRVVGGHVERCSPRVSLLRLLPPLSRRVSRSSPLCGEFLTSSAPQPKTDQLHSYYQAITIPTHQILSQHATSPLTSSNTISYDIAISTHSGRKSLWIIKQCLPIRTQNTTFCRNCFITEALRYDVKSQHRLTESTQGRIEGISCLSLQGICIGDGNQEYSAYSKVPPNQVKCLNWS